MQFSHPSSVWHVCARVCEWECVCVCGGAVTDPFFLFPAAGQRNSREVISKYMEGNAWVAAVYNVFQLPAYILENWV